MEMCKTCLREIEKKDVIFKKQNNWIYCSKLCYEFL